MTGGENFWRFAAMAQRSSSNCEDGRHINFPRPSSPSIVHETLRYSASNLTLFTMPTTLLPLSAMYFFWHRMLPSANCRNAQWFSDNQPTLGFIRLISPASLSAFSAGDGLLNNVPHCFYHPVSVIQQSMSNDS